MYNEIMIKEYKIDCFSFMQKNNIEKVLLQYSLGFLNMGKGQK